MSTDAIARALLPIPDRPPGGLTRFDAKDPETRYAPIVPLRPPAGAPNVLLVLIDDAGFGSSSAFGGPCATPNAEKLAAGGLKVHADAHDGALFADAGGAAVGAQSPYGGDGWDHGGGDVGAGADVGASEHVRAAGRDAEAQRLLDGAVRQVP